VKVILTQTVEKLGKMGEVVDVKDGYARNFLFPKNFAKEATTGNMKGLEGLKKKQAAIEAKKLAEAQAAADKISAISLTIAAEAGEEDKLFGSVTSEMVATALEAEGVKVDKKDIVLDETIKKLGSYQITVKVIPEVKATLKVLIVKKQ
jgi:large subunit ribosomal protein L9